MMTTAFHEPLSAIHDRIVSVVADAVTWTTIFNNKLQLNNNNDVEIKYGANDVKLIMLLNAPLNIIDHGSVVYLFLLQIRFYDKQDSMLLLENKSTVYLILLPVHFYDQHNLLLLLLLLLNGTITMNTYNTVYNLYFDLYFDTVVDGCTGENYFDLYFNTIFNGRISGYNGLFDHVTKITVSYDSSNNQPLDDNNNSKCDSFGCNNKDNLLNRTNKTRMTDAIFHIIDQRSVLYLILLYNQQYVLPSGPAVIGTISFIVGDNRIMTTTVMMEAYDMT